MFDHPLGDRLARHIAISNRRQKVVQLLKPANMGHQLERQINAQPLQILFQDLTTLRNVLASRLLAEPGADLPARPRRRHIAHIGVDPVAAGASPLGRNDLHLVTILKLKIQWHKPAVYLRAPAAVAQFRMHTVGKIDRSRIARQVNHVTARREDVYPVLEHIRLHPADELLGVRHVLPPFHQLANPGNLVVQILVRLSALLIAPVGGNAELGDLVHLMRPNLHLHRLPVRADHRRVQAAVHVVLRAGDVVVKFTRYRPPVAMHHPQCRVAVRHRFNNDSEPVNVVNLVKRHVLAPHLSIDAVNMLGPPVDLRPDARLIQRLRQRIPRLIHPADTLSALLVHRPRQIPIRHRLQIAEAEVLQLPLHLPNPQPVRKRSKNLQCLARDAAPFVLLVAL